MQTETLSRLISAARQHNPTLEVLPPGSLSPEATADTLIKLLQSVYVQHGITQSPEKVIRDIKDGNLQTWLAKKNNRFVSTASLILTKRGEFEIGRAVSLEKGSGKLLMLLAAEEHLRNHNESPLVAEVRVAEEFGDIPSGEVTQHICFALLTLVPHAIAPFFAHGNPKRREQFVLARSDHQSKVTVSEQALAPLNNRNMKGIAPGLKVVQNEPFRIAVPDPQGQNLIDLITTHNLEHGSGFTLFPIEVTDTNMPLVGAMLDNPRMILCGVDSRPGQDQKPVVLFGTIGANTVIAPTNITDAVGQPMRKDLQSIGDRFTQLGTTRLPNTEVDSATKLFMVTAAPGSLY